MSSAPAPSPSERQRATLIGASAIGMWATLGVCSLWSAPLPPFATAAICFAISGLASCALLLATGRLKAALAQPPRIWALGTAGLFGAHACYFFAIRFAPPVQANLLNYLWPLLVVLGSGLTPGHRLKARHVVGALAGFGGAALVVLGKSGLHWSGHDALGYACGAGAAVIWAGYTLLSRRYATHVPSEAVAGYCLATAVLAGLCHFTFEPAAPAPSATHWAALAWAGLFPLGAGFFAWDRGAKHGDLRVLGAAAYATPVLSTGLLIAFGFAPFGWTVAAGCLLVAGGAFLASHRSPPAPPPAVVAEP